MAPKRPTSSLPPRKKQKTGNEDGIKLLERSLTTAIRDGSSLNPLADLLHLAATATDPKTTHAAIYALYRIIVLLAQSGKFSGEKQASEEAEVVRKWLESRLTEYCDLLCGLMKDEEPALRSAALEVMLSLLTHLSTAVSSPGMPRIHLPHFRKFTRALILCPDSSRSISRSDHGQGPGRVELDVCAKFVDDYIGIHDDLRWFFLRESTNIIKSDSGNPHKSDNLLSYLEKLMTMPTDAKEINSFWIKEFSKPPPKQNANASSSSDEEDAQANETDDWRAFFDEKDDDPTANTPTDKKRRVNSMSLRASLHSLDSHRVQFSTCWVTLVPHLAASSTMSARALGILHRGVLPHLTRPVRLMDWIAACVDFGGSVGLLALNGLFTLIKDYNLDYPDFYTRLYAFVDRNVLHVKHRARFFRLADLFLSSTHLPVQLVASFVKRLSRLSLSASPPAIIMIIPFVYNILKRHPALMTLIHQDRIEGYEDPFDADEPLPLLTNAISSSLWELASHQTHYLETVSTLARIFTTPFTQKPYLMEEFLDHTYSTLFEAESKRTFKKDPAMMIDLKKDELFPSDTGTAGEGDLLKPTADIVTELWRFG